MGVNVYPNYHRGYSIRNSSPIIVKIVQTPNLFHYVHFTNCVSVSLFVMDLRLQSPLLLLYINSPTRNTQVSKYFVMTSVTIVTIDSC